MADPRFGRPIDTRTFQQFDPSNAAAHRQLLPAWQTVSDPFKAVGGDKESQRRVLAKVQQAVTDPMAATFAGKGAKLADLKALEEAKAMLAGMERGTPEFLKADRAAWGQTGWTHAFPDGKPRFEISDHAAKMETKANGEPMIDFLKDYTGMEGLPVDFIYSHPELYKNYDELANIRARYPLDTPLDPGRLPTPNSAAYDGLNNIYLGKNIDSIGGKSTLSHELQHAVQEREGFASGGGPGEFLNGGPINPLTGQRYTIEEGFGAYKALAGEAEARLTQSRMNLTPEQRRAQYPIDQFDVPANQQIVRGLLSE